MLSPLSVDLCERVVGGGRSRGRFLPSGGSMVWCKRVQRQPLLAAICTAG